MSKNTEYLNGALDMIWEVDEQLTEILKRYNNGASHKQALNAINDLIVIIHKLRAQTEAQLDKADEDTELHFIKIDNLDELEKIVKEIFTSKGGF